MTFFKALEVDASSTGSSGSSSAPLIVDQGVGEWVEGAVVSRGKFGVVYRGLLEDGRYIAIKKVQTVGMTKKQLKCLANEITLMKCLDHPYIVKYLGFEYTGSTLSILMEYVSGGSLRKFIDVYGALTESLTVIYTEKILRGLSFLHERNVVHHDIKSNNILLGSAAGRGLTDAAPVVKLADFGTSRHLGVRENVVSGMKGTVQWMAPEMVRGEIHFEGRFKADIWSVGCTVIEMLTGDKPWKDITNLMTIMYFIARGDAPPINCNCQVGNDARSFVAACCQADPNLRPTSSSLAKHQFLSNNNAHTTVEGDAGNSVSEIAQTKASKSVSSTDVQQHMGHDYHGAKTDVQKRVDNNRRCMNKGLNSGHTSISGNSNTFSTHRKTKLKSLDMSHSSYGSKGSTSDLTVSITSTSSSNPVGSRSPTVFNGLSAFSTSPISSYEKIEGKSSNSLGGMNTPRHGMSPDYPPSCCRHAQQERHALRLPSPSANAPPHYERRHKSPHLPNTMQKLKRVNARTEIKPLSVESLRLRDLENSSTLSTQQETSCHISILSNLTLSPACCSEDGSYMRVRRKMKSLKGSTGYGYPHVKKSERLSHRSSPVVAAPVQRRLQYGGPRRNQSDTDNCNFPLHAPPRLKMIRSLNRVHSTNDLESWKYKQKSYSVCSITEGGED